MIGWYCPNKFQCNILLSQFELSPLHRWLNIKFDDVDTKARYIYCHNMKNMESEVKYRDKTMTNSIFHGKLKDEIHGCMDSKSW